MTVAGNPKHFSTRGGEPRTGSGFFPASLVSDARIALDVDGNGAEPSLAMVCAGADVEALKLLSNPAIELSENPAARTWLTKAASSDAVVPGFNPRGAHETFGR